MSEHIALTLTLNGSAHQTQSRTLAALLSELENTQQLQSGYAIAINRNFVPKVQYENTRLTHGDDIEILSPMQGG